MREIKFRFWKDNTKEMLSLDESMEFLVKASYLISGKYDNFIPLQFTGLEDKNGKEIYEGDILKGGILHLTGGKEISNEDVATTVTYKDGMFKLGGVSLLSFHRRAEVIGNVYENPELVDAP